MASDTDAEQVRARFVESVSTVLADRAQCPDSIFADGLDDRMKTLDAAMLDECHNVALCDEARSAASRAVTGLSELLERLRTSRVLLVEAGFSSHPEVDAARTNLETAYAGALEKAKERLSLLDEDRQNLTTRVADMEAAHKYLRFIRDVETVIAEIVKEKPDRRLGLLRKFSRDLRSAKDVLPTRGTLAIKYILRYGAASGTTADQKVLIDALDRDREVIEQCLTDVRQVI